MLSSISSPSTSSSTCSISPFLCLYSATLTPRGVLFLLGVFWDCELCDVLSSIANLNISFCLLTNSLLSRSYLTRISSSSLNLPIFSSISLFFLWAKPLSHCCFFLWHWLHDHVPSLIWDEHSLESPVQVVFRDPTKVRASTRCGSLGRSTADSLARQGSKAPADCFLPTVLGYFYVIILGRCGELVETWLHVRVVFV
jgi:hypothetical protein